MPPTKIETGVWIELNRLVVPPNARKHRPEKVASLAKSIKDDGAQLQDIVVCPQDEAAGQALPTGQAGPPLFYVLAGAGRKEAEESLKWDKGRCTIMYGLTLPEKLKITLDENKERQDTTPLDDARLYQAMLDADGGLTQDKLAEREEISQETLSEYLSLTSLSAEVQDFIARAINLKLKHLLQICRLKDEKEQIRLVTEADKAGWSVKELKKQVDKVVGTRASRKSRLHAAGESDPMADIWGKIKGNTAISNEAKWEVGYPAHETWDFRVKPCGGSYADFLAEWFGAMSKAVHDNDPLNQDIGSQEHEDKKEGYSTPRRLPKNEAEEQELKAAAKGGPFAFYRWIYGEDRPDIKAMEGKSWKDQGFQNPDEAYQTIYQSILEALRAEEKYAGQDKT